MQAFRVSVPAVPARWQRPPAVQGIERDSAGPPGSLRYLAAPPPIDPEHPEQEHETRTRHSFCVFRVGVGDPEQVDGRLLHVWHRSPKETVEPLDFSPRD